MLYIVAQHLEELFMWNAIIDNYNQLDHFGKPKINLYPDDLFKLFEAYSKGVLNKNIRIKFPCEYRSKQDTLFISFDIDFIFKDHMNITLEPVVLSQEQINFEHIKCLEQKLNVQYNNLNSRITELEKQLKNNNGVNIKINRLEKQMNNEFMRKHDLVMAYDNELDCEHVDNEYVGFVIKKNNMSIIREMRMFVDKKINCIEMKFAHKIEKLCGLLEEEPVSNLVL